MDPLTVKTVALGALALTLLGLAGALHPNPLDRIRAKWPYAAALVITLLPIGVVFWVRSLNHPQATHGSSDLNLILGSWVIATVSASALIGYHEVKTAGELYKAMIPAAMLLCIMAGRTNSDVGAAVLLFFLVTQLPAAVVGGILGWRARRRLGVHVPD